MEEEEEEEEAEAEEEKRKKKEAYRRAHQDVELPNKDREDMTAAPSTEAVLVQVAKGPAQPAHTNTHTYTLTDKLRTDKLDRRVPRTDRQER